MLHYLIVQQFNLALMHIILADITNWLKLVLAQNIFLKNWI